MDTIKYLKDIEETYLAAPTFDYRYKPWLDSAEQDLCAAKKLLEDENYPLFIYNLQQSVEKSIKYIFISLGIYSENDSRSKISHCPEKAFRKMFEGSEESLRCFNEELNLVKNKNLHERIEYLTPAFQIRYSNLQKDFEQYNDKSLSLEDIVTYFIPDILAEYCQLLSVYSENLYAKWWECKCMEYCYCAQHYLSLVLMGVESDSRYPCVADNYAPSYKYSKEILFEWYPALLKAQDLSISLMKKYSIEK